MLGNRGVWRRDPKGVRRRSKQPTANTPGLSRRYSPWKQGSDGEEKPNSLSRGAEFCHGVDNSVFRLISCQLSHEPPGEPSWMALESCSLTNQLPQGLQLWWYNGSARCIPSIWVRLRTYATWGCAEGNWKQQHKRGTLLRAELTKRVSRGGERGGRQVGLQEFDWSGKQK